MSEAAALRFPKQQESGGNLPRRQAMALQSHSNVKSYTASGAGDGSASNITRKHLVETPRLP